MFRPSLSALSVWLSLSTRELSPLIRGSHNDTHYRARAKPSLPRRDKLSSTSTKSLRHVRNTRTTYTHALTFSLSHVHLAGWYLHNTAAPFFQWRHQYSTCSTYSGPTAPLRFFLRCCHLATSSSSPVGGTNQDFQIPAKKAFFLSLKSLS